MNNQLRFSISESSAAGEARRGANSLTSKLGFDETFRGKVAVVVTEVATNLAKHAKQGQLLIRALERDGRLGLELLALDQGPGMANVNEFMRDGFSTTGSPGTGLGSIARLSDEFDIHSVPGVGTALVARLWSQKMPIASRPRQFEIGVVCLPKPGEDVCGDAWVVDWSAGQCLILVADGLGHGPEAASASKEAVQVLRAHPHLAPTALIEFAHGALRSTRGAAMAVARLDLARGVKYAGVGNIAGVVITPNGIRHMVSHNGIVGHEVRKIQEYTYPWSADALLIVHSDGLTAHWNLSHYPGLMGRDPSLIAGVLYRDFTRGRDDTTVLVVKQR
jgi:anti-sigma regulatory factor (Ser/Thr protein kinase)